MSLGSINELCLCHWNGIAAKLKGSSPDTYLDGRNLDLATVIATARYGKPVKLSDSSVEAVAKSAQLLQSSLDRGEVVYGILIAPEPLLQLIFREGVNTGFGGSANTRTAAVGELQKNLLRMLQYGIISDEWPITMTQTGHVNDFKAAFIKSALPIDDPVAATSMPESWVRASMLIRLNSLALGVSGVKEHTLRTLHRILEAGITPQVPIKGSISASGDLSPLSYIAGVVQGKPGLNVWIRDSHGARCLRRADVALAAESIAPVTLGAKEGLALVNGTAVACAVGSLALHEALGQAVLAQVLTAMSVEALCGTDESFDPFFAEVRPHPGQVESAQNIRMFLSQSSLVQPSGNEEGELRQDRYSVRTASQWLGPVLEDLHLAHQQLTIEMNSTTDNPLIISCQGQGGKIMHGGNFQAKAVTSAMEKTRLSLQSIGQMLFAQCTELINPAMNRGLPPNLVGGEPSQSFIWKGTDIMIAALQAELGFLANPVGSHVQSAEMGNQAINSLALISGRYTLEAVQTLSQLSAAHLVAVCQALDLRAMNIKFMESMAPTFKILVEESFSSHLRRLTSIENVWSTLWTAFQKSLNSITHLDAPKRFVSATESLQPQILKMIVTSVESISALESWTEKCSTRALNIFSINRDHYFAHSDATPYIGIASRRMYQFLRNEVGVPFIGNETIATPRDEAEGFDWGRDGAEQDARKGVTIGGTIAKVYETMRSGQLYHVIMDCVSDAALEKSSMEQEIARLNETTKISTAERGPFIGEKKGMSGFGPDCMRTDEATEHTASAHSLAPRDPTIVGPDEDCQQDLRDKEGGLEIVGKDTSPPSSPMVKFSSVDLDGDIVRVQQLV